MSRNLYLHDIPLDQAIKKFYEKLGEFNLDTLLGIEEIPLDEHAVGRVLAAPLLAVRNSPHYHASAMDGFAVKAESTSAALPSAPVTLSVGLQAIYVDTGDALPEFANSVIPIENVESLDDDGALVDGQHLRKPRFVRIRAAMQPWSHVRAVGEDLVAGQLILPAGERLRAVDLGAAAAGGITCLKVARKPKVGILPTGDELVPLESDPGRGEITEFNSIVLAGQINTWGGQASRYNIVPDDMPRLVESIRAAALENDLVLVNAGSSAGMDDLTSTAIEETGEVIVHGIAVRPGHPVIIGFVPAGSRQVPVIGVPGYPVSAALTAEILVRPLLQRWLGAEVDSEGMVEARLTRKLTSPAGDDDYIRVILGRVNGSLLAAPIIRGAGVTTSLSKADGILVVPRNIQGLEAGERVQVRLYRDAGEIDRNILTIGSHDLTLDILSQALADYNRRLVSSNTGSLGGLLALSRGENHFAGSHLLDPVSGTYNTTEIRRIFPGQTMYALRWVGREQGLLVKKGNPKKIVSLTDLTREDVTFVNRQRGAGTRVLLDYECQNMNIDPIHVRGYTQEEYTHLGVAVAVASGRSDAGLGVASAAESMGLDFVHLFDEEYELIFSEQGVTDALLKPVFDLACDPIFKKKVAALPGYNLIHMGELRSIVCV